jgi:hypothetical protein
MDIKKFKKRAAGNKGRLKKFLAKLDRIVPEDMPKLVKETDARVWKAVDCLACANCCKTMTPTYTASDLKRIAAHFNMTVKAFKEKWLMQDEDNGDWVNKTTPCQFLNLKTNKCSIYEIRPLDCSQFPHHNKKPFDLYNDTFTQNLDKCPATNELILQLEKSVKQDYVW